MRRVLAQRRRPTSLLTVAPIWTVLSVGAWADDVDVGREVYDDFCVSCHGRDMVAPGGVTFDLCKFPKDDFERFRKAVLEGKPPAMPAWRDKISEDSSATGMRVPGRPCTMTIVRIESEATTV
jgi:mono/diheme cytochrome c family protein